MRNLSTGNKMKFTMFAVIIIVILTLLIGSLTIVLRNAKEVYEVDKTAFIYDTQYNYIELSAPATILRKWTGNYYLKEESKKEHDLGKTVVSYDKSKATVQLIGDFYQVLNAGNIKKISGENKINNFSESKFYKIEDRKYLIVGKNIINNTGSLSTSNYLIVVIDKAGNALLLNNEINAKTINQMTISVDGLSFDVANETLTVSNETINLKKILGSTNQYIQGETKEENEVENQTQNETTDNTEDKKEQTNVNTIVVAGGNGGATSSTTQNDSSTTLVNNETTKNTDNSWQETLNGWINNVGDAFGSIFNKDENNKDETNTQLSRSISLNNVTSGVTYLDINYSITDPENKYQLVYLLVTDGSKDYTISLDKAATTYRVSNLVPNRQYTVQIGYKVIKADATSTTNLEDTMIVKTTKPTESLEIAKVSANKIYFNLKLDANFAYEQGKLNLYVDGEKIDTITLTNDNLEEATKNNGYTGSFKYTKGKNIVVKLEETKHSANMIDTKLQTKIINY